MSEKRPRTTLAREGFSLVEVLVALVVLSVGVLAVAGLAASSVRLVRSGFNVTNSTLAAQQVLDFYRVVPFDSIALGTAVDTITLGGQSYTVASTVTDVSAQMSYGDADILYQIVVYAGGGMDQKYAERFETFIYNGEAP
jgi:type IV pilus assembly protein PilV